MATKEEISVFWHFQGQLVLESLPVCRIWIFIPYSICLNVYLAFLCHKEFICSSTLPIALFVPLTVTSFLLSLYLLAYSYPSPYHILTVTSISHSNSYVVVVPPSYHTLVLSLNRLNIPSLTFFLLCTHYITPASPYPNYDILEPILETKEGKKTYMKSSMIVKFKTRCVD